jgi:multiple antibiotic resistance protein
MKDYLQAIVTVLSLINPAVCALMFSQIEAGRPRRSKLRDSLTSSVVIFAILSLAAIFGVQVLQLFGISLDAFDVAGGGVLAWIGFRMLAGSSPNRQEAGGSTGAPGSLTNLIMFAASPGTITGVITLAAASRDTRFPIATLAAVAFAVIVTCCVLALTAAFGGHRRGESLVRDTVTKFMGLIVIAMGVQLALNGYRAFMAAAQ